MKYSSFFVLLFSAYFSATPILGQTGWFEDTSKEPLLVYRRYESRMGEKWPPSEHVFLINRTDKHFRVTVKYYDTYSNEEKDRRVWLIRPNQEIHLGFRGGGEPGRGFPGIKIVSTEIVE